MKYIGLFVLSGGLSTEYDCHLNVSMSHFRGCEGSDGRTGEALRGCEEASGGSKE